MRGSQARAFSIRLLQAAGLVLPVIVLGLLLVLLLDRQAPDREPATPPGGGAVSPRADVQRSIARRDVAHGAEPALAPVAESEPPQVTAPGGGPIVALRRGREIELRASPLGDGIATIEDETEFGSPTVLSVQRRRGGWLGVSTHEVANGDLAWIRANGDSLRGGWVDYSIDVDLSSRTTSLYRGERKLQSWPVTIGAPDSPTPTGRFAVTDTFRGGLAAAYGCCAVAISATQPDLPSGWEGGNRIAFHGTAGPVGEAASHGCIRSADRFVSALVDTVPLGTPVHIHD